MSKRLKLRSCRGAFTSPRAKSPSLLLQLHLRNVRLLRKPEDRFAFFHPVEAVACHRLDVFWVRAKRVRVLRAACEQYFLLIDLFLELGKCGSLLALLLYLRK